MLCNVIPQLDHCDNELLSQIQRVDFTTKFVPNPENEKQIDYTIIDKIGEWSQAFMWMLLQSSVENNKKHTIPISMIEKTSKKSRNDIG